MKRRGDTEIKANQDRKPLAKRAKSAGCLALSWGAVIAWSAVIFYMSSRTSTGLSTGFFGMVEEWSKNLFVSVFGFEANPLSTICHFLEYLVLGALLANALKRRMTPMRALIFAIALASIYGASDEFHQLFVKGRMCDPADWLTDTIGAAVGSVAFSVCQLFRNRS